MYTQDQTTFCLNIISNLCNLYNGNPQSYIQSHTQTAIDSILSNSTVAGQIGTWKRVWGPVVNTYMQKATNTMYVAQNASSNQYVIAIAGTDPSSYADWFFDDFDVLKTQPWPNVDGAVISQATYNGLHALLGMTYNDVSLIDFLKTSGANNITVTGHSLGGALSPTLALYLSDNKSQWATGTVRIASAAVAGATPGNSQFATYFNQQIGANANTKRVWNSLDVVPHGFEHDMMLQISKLYSPAISCPIAISGVVDTVAFATKGIGYTQLLSSVPGFNLSIYQPQTTFTGQALYEHVSAYANYFGIIDFQTSVQQILNLTTPFFSGGTVYAPAQATA